jgi:hypothetical protein
MVRANNATCSNTQSFGFSGPLLTVILLSLVEIHLLLNELVSMGLRLETTIVSSLTVVVTSCHVSILLAILIISHVYNLPRDILLVIALWCTNRCALTIMIHVNSSVRLTNFLHFKMILNKFDYKKFINFFLWFNTFLFN